MSIFLYHICVARHPKLLSFRRKPESSGQRVASGDTSFYWIPGQARYDDKGSVMIGIEPCHILSL